MAFEKTWLQAVKDVMRENGKPMHYTDIAQAIVDQGFRKNPGATPANTVATTFHHELKKGPDKSAFKKIAPGIFALKDAPALGDDEDTVVEDAEEATEAAVEKNPIKAFGMFWRRDKVQWTQKPTLLGEQLSGSNQVNFSDQAGVYLLHDQTRVIYVGQASVDGSLGARLYAHTRNRLSGRWDRFSWFGVRKVNNKDGSLADISESGIEYGNFIGALEAVLIEGVEPPQNRRAGEGFGFTESIEWHQKEDPTIAEKRNRAWLESKLGQV
jgi:hypothetical protein